MIKRYHSAIATLAASTAIINSHDLGGAKMLATLAKQTFVPPQHRAEVTDAFGELKKTVAKSTLSDSAKQPVIDEIDAAVTAVTAQPHEMPHTQNGGAYEQKQPDRNANARPAARS